MVVLPNPSCLAAGSGSVWLRLGLIRKHKRARFAGALEFRYAKLGALVAWVSFRDFLSPHSTAVPRYERGTPVMDEPMCALIWPIPESGKTVTRLSNG